jgi:hypothetical protein
LKKAFLIGGSLLALHLLLKQVRKNDPSIILVDSLPNNYNASTIPPFGIYVVKDQANNKALIDHEKIHWQQYQHMGLLNYYLTYFAQKNKYGYDKMPMEVEARANETDFCKANYTSCVRNGSALTITNKNFRS